MKIIIIKLAAIGDVLRTTCILKGLQEKYRPSQIDWITSKAAKEVLRHNSLINNLFGEIETTLENYNLVISLEDDQKAVQLACRIKTDQLIGTYLKDRYIAYTPSEWFDMSLISKYGIEKANLLKKNNQKTFQQHLSKLLGVRTSEYIYQLTTEEVEYGKKFIKGRGISKNDKIIGINTSAGKRWQHKSWGAEQTIELCKKIYSDLGAVPLLLGGEAEKERNQIIAVESKALNSEIHPLRNFSSIINQCQLIVCSDSLALHLAIALRKKIVAFFGPTSAAEIEMYGLGVKLTSKIDCLTCYKKTCDKKPNCMDLLSTREMILAVKNML